LGPCSNRLREDGRFRIMRRQASARPPRSSPIGCRPARAHRCSVSRNRPGASSPSPSGSRRPRTGIPGTPMRRSCKCSASRGKTFSSSPASVAPSPAAVRDGTEAGCCSGPARAGWRGPARARGERPRTTATSFVGGAVAAAIPILGRRARIQRARLTRESTRSSTRPQAGGSRRCRFTPSIPGATVVPSAGGWARFILTGTGGDRRPGKHRFSIVVVVEEGPQPATRGWHGWNGGRSRG
jgi:hypothetical protein